MSDKKNKKQPELNELKRFELPEEQQDAVTGGNNTGARPGTANTAAPPASKSTASPKSNLSGTPRQGVLK